MTAERIDFILSALKYGGIIVAGFSGVLGALTKTHDNKRKLTIWGRVSVVLTVIGVFVAVGAQYTEASRQRIQETRQREANARTEGEFREKFQAVLVQLNAAKHEDSKRITEEKIRVLEKEFTQWALAFDKNKTKIKGDLEQLRAQTQIETTKKEILSSEQFYPVISFTVRYIQKMVSAFAKQSGKEIVIDPVELPQNFYEKPTEFAIHFPGKTIWNLKVMAGRPAFQNGPNLTVIFTDSESRPSGSCHVFTYPETSTFHIIYQPIFPVPGFSAPEQEGLTNFESSIRTSFQTIIETQLVRATE